LPDILTRAGLKALPFGASISTLYEGLHERRSARAAEALKEIEYVCPDADDLIRRLEASDPLDAIVTRALNEAADAGFEAKRRLLGRVAAQALVDEAKLDRAVLLIPVIAQLEAPHIRALVDIRQAVRDAEASGEVPARAKRAEQANIPRIIDAGERHDAAVIATLATTGLIEVRDATGPWPMVKYMMPLGEELLQSLPDDEKP
jgi:hypothetical protein